jgi:hypothetical protein
VLDACRDNPFSWARSGIRGLTVISNQPADSIVVYATSTGSVAQDGTGRNGLFTSCLLKNLKTPGLEVKEIFNRTGADVIVASERKQIPEVYNKFFGNAYFIKPVVAQPAPLAAPLAAPSATVTPQPTASMPPITVTPSPPPVTPQSATGTAVVRASDEDGITKPFTSVSSFGEWLSRQPNNTVRTSYNVKLNVSDISDISKVLLAAQQKYVYLNLTGSSFTSIGQGAFENCDRLVGVTIPDGVISIGDFAFQSCTSISSVTLPNIRNFAVFT